MHEATLYKENAFVTLTYDDANLPEKGQLDYTQYQKFMKRLRKHYAPRQIRFYMCGEYGPQLQRPHFHACLFNIDFQDKTFWAPLPSGGNLYRSQTLEKLWPFGFSSIGDVNFETAAYVARYCMKKITGHNAQYHYHGLTPEFNKMSLKPGIGTEFLKKWTSDIYPNDYVIVNNKKTQPPKYYDKIYKKMNKEKYEEIKMKREMNGRKNYEDNTETRLETKEQVTKARLKYLKRGMQDYENSIS